MFIDVSLKGELAENVVVGEGQNDSVDEFFVVFGLFLGDAQNERRQHQFEVLVIGLSNEIDLFLFVGRFIFRIFLLLIKCEHTAFFVMVIVLV